MVIVAAAVEGRRIGKTMTEPKPVTDHDALRARLLGDPGAFDWHVLSRRLLADFNGGFRETAAPQTRRRLVDLIDTMPEAERRRAWAIVARSIRPARRTA